MAIIKMRYSVEPREYMQNDMDDEKLSKLVISNKIDDNKSLKENAFKNSTKCFKNR